MAYHDDEWGVPTHDEQRLFEMLVLEGFQAGLSWITILRKRENFRAAFHSFNPEAIAGYKKRDLDRLALDTIRMDRETGQVHVTSRESD